MSTEKTISLYIKLALAIIKGDDAEATALKIQKKAISIMTAQIAVKTAHTLTLEEELEEKENALALVRVNNGNLITSGDEFLLNILKANKAVKDAKDKITKHEEEIEFLKSELAIASK